MRYYSRNQNYSNVLGTDYPMVRMLMIANVIVYVIQWLFSALLRPYAFEDFFALTPKIWDGYIWQVFTYMFLHSVQDPFHIIFNMLALWMFGKELEMVWGSREFLKYYLVCGVGGGLTFLFFSHGVVLGASGAVFGILLAFGMTFPDQIILMSFLFPIKAKYMVIIYGVITFLNIAKPAGDSVAHLAHLGGMVFGFVYLKREWMQFKLTEFQRPHKPIPKEKPSVTVRPQEWPDRSKEIRSRVDAILDKINEVGYNNLTEEEKNILFQASHQSDPPRPKS